MTTATQQNNWNAFYTHPGALHRKFALRVVRNWAESLVPGSTVIDIGCGVGRNAAWLLDQGHEVYACDPSGAALEAYRSGPHVSCPTYHAPDQATAEALPHIGGCMDAAMCIGVLHYVPIVDIVTCLKEMLRVLKPQGRYLFNVRSRQDCRAFGDIPEHERGIALTFLSEPELHNILADVGMNNCNVRLESFNGNRDWVVEGVK